MNMRNLTIVLFSTLSLIGCVSAEYQVVRNSCSATWHEKIPTQFEEEKYTEHKTRQVRTGERRCGYDLEDGEWYCKDVMRTERYTEPAVRTVDRNKPRRDAQIQACTQKACIERYGNPKCETG